MVVMFLFRCLHFSILSSNLPTFPIWKIIDLMLWHFAASHFYGHQLNPIIIIRRKYYMHLHIECTSVHNRYKLKADICKVWSAFYYAMHCTLGEIIVYNFSSFKLVQQLLKFYMKFFVWNIMIVHVHYLIWMWHQHHQQQ